jgi:hypothetical protein
MPNPIFPCSMVSVPPMETKRVGPTCGQSVSLLMQALVIGLSHDPALATFGEKTNTRKDIATKRVSRRMSEHEANTFEAAPEQHDMLGGLHERRDPD